MAEIDIAKHKRRYYKKKKDLSKFLRKFGKTKKRGIVKLALEVDKETWKDVACLDCANCCKKMTPTYSKKDIKRISAHFGQTSKQFYDKWLKVDENKDVVNKSTPCQFLGKDNKCTIYAIRPLDCAEFPHFVRKDVKYQAAEKTYTNNMAYCPATLRFVERLQEAVGADF
jgi:Fe-S-cluster containining protein